MTMNLMAGDPGASKESKRKRLGILETQLKNARQSFESHWRDIGEHFRVRRVRLQPNDKNKGDKRSQKIIDSTGVFAARTLSSGMMSGITSPARRWFKMTLRDKALLERESVKVWLEDVRGAMSDVLSGSNFYAVLPTYYSDLGVFGTSAMIVEEDEEEVIRCTHFAVGEYWIGYNERQQVRVFMRQFELTVRQVVGQFGKRVNGSISTENLSDTVQSEWKAGNTESPVLVTHCILENAEQDAGRLESKYKRYLSCYFETSARHDVFLDEGGFEEWPIMAVRWESVTGDVYATECPGMIALGSNKELQFGMKVGSQALNKAVNPPMVADAGLMNSSTSILAGGVTYVSGNDIDKKFRPVFDTSSFRLDWLEIRQEQLRDEIRRAFFEDLFLMISAIDRSDVTATEILEKKEEKLLSLGPVLEQVNDGFLDPFFERLYGIMLRKGLIPEPPPELEGVEFHPEYESIMAQAQRSQGRSGVEAFANFTTAVAAMNPNDPSPLDKINRDEMIERYAEMAGVPPKFIVSDEDVAETRQGRAEAQAQQMAAEQAQIAAESANKLAGADMSGDNALTALMGAGSDTLGGAPGPVGGI